MARLEKPGEEKVNLTPTYGTVLRYPNLRTHLEGSGEEKVNYTPMLGTVLRYPSLRTHLEGPREEEGRERTVITSKLENLSRSKSLSDTIEKKVCS